MVSLSLNIFAFALTFTRGEAHGSPKPCFWLAVPKFYTFNNKLEISNLGYMTPVSHSRKH